MEQPRATPLSDPAALLGDGRALTDILAMAGPASAARILRQIHTDLSETRRALCPALAAIDWTAIRAETITINGHGGDELAAWIAELKDRIDEAVDHALGDLAEQEDLADARRRLYRVRGILVDHISLRIEQTVGPGQGHGASLGRSVDRSGTAPALPRAPRECAGWM